MKTFCFLNEDELDKLPKDFKLIPFDVAYLKANRKQDTQVKTNNKEPIKKVT